MTVGRRRSASWWPGPSPPAPVPTHVLGVTLTPAASALPGSPTATATPDPLAFTGDATRVMSDAGLLLVAAGSAMMGRSERRWFGRSPKR